MGSGWYNSISVIFRCFYKWLDKWYMVEYLGAWIEEVMRKEMAANEARGYARMLGSIDCIH